MFREMRRKNQALTLEESITILEQRTSGVLALLGDNNYSYAVPISFVYDKESSKIYFHSAKSGHKLDAIQKNCNVSFCVIDQDYIVPEKYTTYFRSVIVFGKIRVLEDNTEKRIAIEKLAAKYAPNNSKQKQNETINKEFSSLCLLELQIEHISGKQAKELII